MGVHELQAMFEGTGVAVDLFRVRRSRGPGLPAEFRLAIDAEDSLDRLYGGFFSDWACGGQWARCVQFFVTLKTALEEHRVGVCVCFDGAAPPPDGGPPPGWLRAQADAHQKINSVLRHVASKGTPPPKVWWVPPAGLHSCLRNALRYLNVPACQTASDHHVEVVALCQDGGCAGVVGRSGEYLALRPPRYFGSGRLKLTYRSSLETEEYDCSRLAAELDVPPARLGVALALLGDDRLPEGDLVAFHARLSRAGGERLQGEALVRAVARHVRDFPADDVREFRRDAFGDDPRGARFEAAVRRYERARDDGCATARRRRGTERGDGDAPRLASDRDPPRPVDFAPVPFAYGRWADEEFPDAADEKATSPPPPFPAEVVKTCSERHSKGLMTPSVLTVLTRRQIVLPAVLEDENHRELPSFHHLFRPIRQNVYAVLFNMHHYHYMAANGKEGDKTPSPPPVVVSEWIYTRHNPGRVPESVPGVMLNWPVPTVQRLWFGATHDDKCRRLRAFLSCMRSDSPLMLNTSYVPQHLLILATVLRYIMTSSSLCLRRHELDAFLATAFAADLMNPLLLQEMTVTGLTSRGVQLGALLMTGVDAALFANDACGAPIWWPFTSPWLYFDGKLFQQKLAKANAVKNLGQLCDNQVDVVIKVERMRKAILEGLDVEFAMPPMPLNPNVLGMGGYPPPGALNWPGQKIRGVPTQTHRNVGGGRLEIAGVVVGQWGANYARATQAVRHAAPQAAYTAFPAQTTPFGTRGRGRGRAAAPASVPVVAPAVVSRGGQVRRPRHRAARQPATRRRPDQASGPAKDPSSVDGKTSQGSDGSSFNGAKDSADVVADPAADGQNDQVSDNGESPDASPDNSTEGGKPQKNTKLNKKNASKGKKKVAKETEGGVQVAENCSAAGPKNKISGKPSTSIVNGSNGTNGDHKSQGDRSLQE